MSKTVLGLMVGGILGVVDGLSALVSAPSDRAVRAALVGIVTGAIMKGAIGGAVIGWFATRSHSMAVNLTFGMAVGLALAFLVCVFQKLGGQPPYYWQILLPGGLFGLIVGYTTARYGHVGGRSTSPPPTKAGRCL